MSRFLFASAFAFAHEYELVRRVGAFVCFRVSIRSRYPLGVSRSDPPRAFDSPPPPSRRVTARIVPTRQGPEVWLASWDLGALQSLGLRLHGRARVLPARDPRVLARADEQVLVVLDAQAPGLDLHEAAEVLLGTQATTVVWGASPGQRKALAELPGTRRWVHVPLETSARELAELVATLI
jgi:hypothetical protein